MVKYNFYDFSIKPHFFFKHCNKFDTCSSIKKQEEVF